MAPSYDQFYKTRKWWVKLLLWALLVVVVLHEVRPMVSPSWNLIVRGFSGLWMLIKRRPFVYIILNFIIISILISSSSISEKFNNLLLKIHKKSSHNISSLISQTSQKLFDDDTWWSRIVNSEETERFTPLDESHHHVQHGDYEEKTVSFEPLFEKLQEVKEEENDDYTVESTDVKEEEEDVATLDATWQAIMEAKNKGSGPQLKKSGTWSSGDRGGGGEVEKVSKGRLAKYKVELKKWRTFSREVVQEKKDCRGESCGDGGGGGGGWRGREVALTYHDELKKRADAFIARVTHDMRLQRLESDQRLLDTINRGV